MTQVQPEVLTVEVLLGRPGPPGSKGDKGDPGDTGADGGPGPRGNAFLNGHGPPDPSLGIDGDSYQDDDDANGAVYRKTLGAWSFATDMLGPQGPQGDPGAKGDKGDTGNTGPAGPGVPVGGTTGQILAKASNTDFDDHWIAAPTAPVTTVAGRTGDVVLTTTDVGGLGTAATHATADFDAAGAAAAAQAASQPLDTDLTNIAALTTTSYGRGFLTQADATAGRSYLSLGTAATQNIGTFLQAASNLSDLTNTTTARSSLGLAAIAASGSAADLTTGTLPAGRFPALTGDATTTAGALAVVLATVNSNTGSWGDATHVAQITLNGKGLATAAASVAIALTATGDATGTLPGALTLATVNSNVGSFGDASHTTTFTVNGKGLVTAAAQQAIAIAAGAVSGLAAVATSGSAADLSTGTLPAGRFPALTGDVTTTAGALAATLATVNSSPGTTGDATHTSQITTNGKGLVTANTAVTIQIAESQVTSLVTDLAAKEATANKGAASGYASLDSGTKVPIAQLPTGSTSSTVTIGNDSRLSDSRTPTAHASTHASAGSDPVTLAESQITNLTTDLAAKATNAQLAPLLCAAYR